MPITNLKQKILKPWFIHNPFLIIRAIAHEVRFSPRGWRKVKICFGVNILCDTRKVIGRTLFKNGVYELATSEVIWRMLRKSPNSMFVDVGANVGYYSLLARKSLGLDGTVVCFEPLPSIYSRLLINSQGMAIDTHQYAVSSSKGHSTLSIPDGFELNDGLATLNDCADVIGKFTVKTVSLDEFINKEIYILKIDVEGHEYDVLSGAKNLLKEGNIKNIIFEEHDVENSSAISLLQSYGYEIVSIGWEMNQVIFHS